MTTHQRAIQTTLINAGHMTTDKVTTRPTWRTCRACSAKVLAAIEDEPPTCPRVRVQVDPTPLTVHGELQALLAGVATFTDHGTGLNYRGPETITHRPANTTTVYPAHKCGATWETKPGKTHLRRYSTPPATPIPF